MNKTGRFLTADYNNFYDYKKSTIEMKSFIAIAVALIAATTSAVSLDGQAVAESTLSDSNLACTTAYVEYKNCTGNCGVKE